MALLAALAASTSAPLPTPRPTRPFHEASLLGRRWLRVNSSSRGRRPDGRGLHGARGQREPAHQRYAVLLRPSELQRRLLRLCELRVDAAARPHHAPLVRHVLAAPATAVAPAAFFASSAISSPLASILAAALALAAAALAVSAAALAVSAAALAVATAADAVATVTVSAATVALAAAA